jgi:hypothetical protein
MSHIGLLGQETICAGANYRPDTLRSLGAFEHFFWVLDQYAPTHFAVTAEISGERCPTDWRSALEAVQKRHPLLGVCIEPSGNGTARFRRMETTPIPLRFVWSGRELDWETEVAMELAAPFHPRKGPLIRAVVMHRPGGASLTLVAHHAIADGLGLSYVIRDVLEALAGAAREPLPMPSSQEQILGLSDDLPDEDNEAWNSIALEALLPQRPPLARPVVKSLRLPADVTCGLRERARLEGTTVHGALCAAVVIAGRGLWPNWQNDHVRVLSPINSRKLLEIGDDSCAVSIGATCGSFPPDNSQFWDVARLALSGVRAGQLRESLVELLSGLQQQVSRTGFDPAAAAQFCTEAFPHEVMVSNLGVVPFPDQFGDIKLEALWGPATIAGNCSDLTIGAATVDGSLCLTQTTRSHPRCLLEAMRDILAEACSVGVSE